ncbi:MAG: phenylalanine--tRNA ligase subunit beta [Bacilli bacterium]|nr:phenylalanine--tRNA ligase subunit beta [Bacilli bacterium]
MKVSLNWIKKYVDIPKDITSKQIAYDVTVRTVEVEDVIDTSAKFHDIVVGKILEVKKHPNADLLRICITDIGEKEPVQIVCGGSNLYEGELVVVSKPGAEVIWHGEGEPVKLKETKVRGELSYGMICGAVEVYLDKLFPPKEETEIVDLSAVDCKPGDNVADALGLSDIVLDIDNKSLTNRPDLWGHYGMAREIAAIYDLKLKPLKEVKPDKNLPKYEVEIKEPEKCPRYTATEVEGLYEKTSPLWMQVLLTNVGLRPINAIVDITNYVMLAVGQPGHAFDSTHVEGNKIIVRNAKKGEKLLLLDDNDIELTTDDLVICDTKEPMGLAGIRGGKKDSVLPDTTKVVFEIANFDAKTVRKTDKRFDEKTDSAIRYEKNLDTETVSLGVSLTLELLKEIFPDSKIVSYNDVYSIKTERAKIEVSQEFLDTRLGKVLDRKSVLKVLTNLGYDVEFKDGVYHVVVPVWRSTGDVSIKDDVMGDIARLLSYESFEKKPLLVKFDSAVKQVDVLLERRIKEYLAFRCGFNEIFTYPWMDDKYIKAAGFDIKKPIKLATPPAPELSILRTSLIPGMLEAISKNMRYYSDFKLFEVAQVFENGEYHPSTKEETLPIHKKYLTGAIVGKDAKKIFFEAKGVIEKMSEYTHMENLSFKQGNKPTWADPNAYLDIMHGNKVVGSIGLVSAKTMLESGIKRTNIAMFELNTELFVSYPSRTNEFKHLPLFPLVEKDLSIIVDESVTWGEIVSSIKKIVKDLKYVGEYRGNQIPEGKKSITLRVWIGNDDSTMTSEQINNKMNGIMKVLHKNCKAELREE